jgi:nitric oxide reductase NorQ protein
MSNREQFLVKAEPFYQAQGREVELYAAAYAARLPVMVKGPTGCGKSRFVEYMAWKLGKPLVSVACNEDMTASIWSAATCSTPAARAGSTAR